MWPPLFLMTHNQPNDDNDNCCHIATGKKRPNKLRVSCSNVFLIVFHFTNDIFLSFNDNEIRGRCLKVSSIAGTGGEMEEMRTLMTKMKMKMMTTRLETHLCLEPQVSFFFVFIYFNNIHYSVRPPPPWCVQTAAIPRMTAGTTRRRTMIHGARDTDVSASRAQICFFILFLYYTNVF